MKIVKLTEKKADTEIPDTLLNILKWIIIFILLLAGVYFLYKRFAGG